MQIKPNQVFVVFLMPLLGAASSDQDTTTTTLLQTLGKLSSDFNGEVHGTMKNLKNRALKVSGAFPVVSRSLQATSAPGDDDLDDSWCAAEEGGNFLDDDFNIDAFANNFEPICTCVEPENPFEDLFAVVSSGTSPAEIVEIVNTALTNVSFYDDEKCENTCSACYDNPSSGTNFCGLMSTQGTSNIEFFSTENITVTDLLNIDEFAGGDITSVLNVSDAFLLFENCVEYTSGLDGTVCFGFFAEGLTGGFNDYFETLNLECFASYNGVDCNSCTYKVSDTDDEEDCISADCTNLEPGATIDTCAGTGFVGVFGILEVIGNENRVLTQGPCLGDPVVTAPTASPTEIEEAPSDAPSDSPVVEMQVDPTDSPTGSPTEMEDEPTSSPVTASPTISPTTELTSDTIGVEMWCNGVVLGFVTLTMAAMMW